MKNPVSSSISSSPARQPPARNYGVDAARILAIVFVVLQHVVFLGGIDNCGGFVRKVPLRCLEALSQCSVDLFGLITGYVCWRATKWNVRRFASLWLQVWTTGLLVLGGLALAGRPVSSADWLRGLFPLVFNEYWYFTGYAVVFALMPLLNRLPARNVVSLVLFLVVSAFTFWPGGLRLLPLAKGYSAAWLVILFLFGGTLRSLASRWTVRPHSCFLFAGAMVALTVAQRLAMSAVPSLRSLFADEWTLLPYTSPTVVLTAAALLVGLSRLDVRSEAVRKAIAVLAPCAFGVYLLHVQPLFFQSVWRGSFAWLDSAPDLLLAPAVVLVVLVVFLACLLVELLRRAVVRCLSLAFGSVEELRRCQKTSSTLAGCEKLP